MTAIAAIVENDHVWMGGDSAGVAGLSLSLRSDPKVFRNGEFLLGYTSSFRMGQLLEYHFSPSVPHEGEVGMAYMVRTFVPAIRELFKSHGYLQTDKGREEAGQFLVGWRGELYSIDIDFQVGRQQMPFFACGCGAELVLGSLYSTAEYEIDPAERIDLALRAAEAFSVGVRGPFTILASHSPDAPRGLPRSADR